MLDIEAAQEVCDPAQFGRPGLIGEAERSVITGFAPRLAEAERRVDEALAEHTEIEADATRTAAEREASAARLRAAREDLAHVHARQAQARQAARGREAVTCGDS